ncbi:hypothetical protein GQ457_14G013350 [Hibiscus cannabinus]
MQRYFNKEWKYLNTPTKSKQREDTTANPNAATVPDNPTKVEAYAEARKDQEIPHETKEVDLAAVTQHIKLPRSDTLEDMRPPSPFQQRLKKHKHEYQFKKFFDILKQVHNNLPLVEALQQIPNRANFLKDMVTKKRRIKDFETAAATKACLAKEKIMRVLLFPAP